MYEGYSEDQGTVTVQNLIFADKMFNICLFCTITLILARQSRAPRGGALYYPGVMEKNAGERPWLV